MLRRNFAVQLPTEIEADRMTVFETQKDGCNMLDTH